MSTHSGPQMSGYTRLNAQITTPIGHHPLNAMTHTTMAQNTQAEPHQDTDTISDMEEAAAGPRQAEEHSIATEESFVWPDEDADWEEN